MSNVFRALGALRTTYFDDASPRRITDSEWSSTVAPALGRPADAGAPTRWLMQRVSDWAALDPGAQRAAKAWLRPAGQDGRVALADAAPDGDPVYLTTAGAFTVHADGTPSESVQQLGSALYRAASCVQANFGQQNFFVRDGVDLALKREVFTQLRSASRRDLSQLEPQQRRQYTASIGSLLIELFKALPHGGRAAALRGDVFDAIAELAERSETPATTRRILIARMQDRQFRAGLSDSQRATNERLLTNIAPSEPIPYARFARRAAREGKVQLNIEHACGVGDGALPGYALSLEAAGFSRVSGDLPHGPCTYVRTVAADDPRNAWGKPFETRITLRHFRDDMYAAMDDPNVHWVSYGGHASFGRHKLNSLENAPEAEGYKLILTDLCCGSDGIDAEFAKYPNVPNLTTHCSSYFRTREHPDYGTITSESEGQQMMQVMLDGVLAKKDWAAIEDDLRRDANWWGHPTGNNWMTPNAWRRSFRELDADNDGVSDLMDALPSYNTFEPEVATERELALRLPEHEPDALAGRRPFLATRALNTATPYNPVLQGHNGERDVVGGPAGAWFAAKPGQTEYVRFAATQTPTGDDVLAARFSSALASASVEALRAVLFYEYVQQVSGSDARPADAAERKLMGAVFAVASLANDSGHRDQQIFKNLKRLYNLPEDLALSDVKRALRGAETQRHNYTGDAEAVAELRQTYENTGVWDALLRPDVGVPSVAVQEQAGAAVA